MDRPVAEPMTIRANSPNLLDDAPSSWLGTARKRDEVRTDLALP
jgi:hypothetical protein